MMYIVTVIPLVVAILIKVIFTVYTIIIITDQSVKHNDTLISEGPVH